MKTDLEALIRDALTYGDIGADDLGQPRLRAAEQCPTRRWVAVTVAAAAVLATAGVGAFAAHERESNSTASRTLDGVAGYRWQVTSINDHHGTATLTASWGAAVSFSKDGVVLGSDGVNDMSAGYHAAKGGYVLNGGATTTEVGYSGSDEVRNRAIDAVDALFGLHDGRQTATGRTVYVSASLRNVVLKLHRGSVTVTAVRAGEQSSGNTEPTAFPHH